MAGLGALRHLDLDHLDLRQGRVRAERLRVEVAVRVPAAEVAGADLPDQVAAGLLVVARQPALAGVVGEAARLGALVHRPDRGLAQGAEAHRGDVQHRGGVGLGALLAADRHPEVVLRVGHHRPRRDRVVQPAVAGVVHVVLGAERLLVPDALGPLVDHRPGVPVERAAVGVVLHEVLVELRAHPLEQEPHPARDRVVAQDAVPQLEVVVDPQQHQRHEEDLQQPPPRAHQHGQRDHQQGEDDDRPEHLGPDAFHVCSPSWAARASDGGRRRVSVEDVAVLVALVRAGGGGEGRDVVAGEEPLEVVAALDVLGDEQRVRRALREDLLQVGVVLALADDLARGTACPSRRAGGRRSRRSSRRRRGRR